MPSILTMPSKILIVDDEEKLRSLLARIVAMEGFTVLQAGDLRSASKILQKENIDVVRDIREKIQVYTMELLYYL